MTEPLTDRERIEVLFDVVRSCVNDIEDYVGELSDEQRSLIVGDIAGIALATVDDWHPRPDGRSWGDVLDEVGVQGDG